MLAIGAVALSACNLVSPGGGPTPSPGILTGTVTAGPVCPVEHDPPDPSCADRPVRGAVLVVEEMSGREIARTSSGADGRFRLQLGPGTYRLVPQPVDGLLGTPQPTQFSLRSGAPATELPVSYDTGIR